MTLTQEALLKKFADKKREMKELQAELDALEPKVLGFLEKQGLDTLKEPWGTYSIVTRKKWSYTDTLIEKEKQFKIIIADMQLEEKNSGEAKAEEIKGLSFRARDEE